MSFLVSNSLLCRVVCRRGDIKHLEDLVLSASSAGGRVSVEEEILLYQDTVASLKVMEEGSVVLCWRFVSMMLMHVVPGARGAHTYLAEVGSWRDLMIFWRPGGWQQRASSLMMCALSKLVVAHKWYVLMSIFDSDRHHCRMSTRSPRGSPRVFQIVSLLPHIQ